MNKKLPLIISILAILVSLGTFGYIFLKEDKVVYIDSNMLLNEYQGMADARAEYEKKSAAWKANIDTLQNEVTKQIMDYEKRSVSMTAKEKELSQELIRTKQKQFKDYQQAIRQQARQEDQQMTQRVLDKVNAFIKDYGDRHGYRIILGTGQGNIAYAEESLDITEDVLEALNNEYLGL